MTEEKVFLNGEIIPAEQAEVSVADGGYLYGMGLFETLRAVGGRVFRLADHIDRLLGSAKTLELPIGQTKEELAEAAAKLLQANELADARMRITATSIPADSGPRGNLLITAAPFVPYPQDYYAKGARAVITDFRQNPKDPTCGHKCTCYAPRLIALRQAHAKLAVEALWFTTENRLAEGCVSNVFLVKDKTLLTPPTETPVLPGIARKTVLEIAEKENIPCSETELSIHDLLGAEEVFLTNVIMEVLPVCAVESHTVGDGKPGPITKQLMEAYKKRLEEK